MNVFTLFKDFFYYSYYYREYLKQSVARDLRKKYKRSYLGYLWSMLNPLLMMIILAIVFSNIMRGHIENYAVFLFCGMIPWAYFDGTVQACLGTIRQHAKIIDQIAVPKFIFPLSTAIYDIVTFLLSLLTLIIVIIVTGHKIHLSALALVIVFIPLFFFTVGVSLILAASNVFYEDTQHLTSVLLRAVYFLCPILYDRSMLPEWLVKWVVINPMFGIIEAMRNIFYYGVLPNQTTYFLNLTGSIFILALGLWVFKKADDKFIYFV
jgi:ABC-type polysaccharide/polyol phosphate export permease